MIKTLVIHPDDRSTDFLKPIYQHLDEYSEAAYCKVPTFIDEVEQSNALFANIVGQSVLMEAKNIQANTKLLYHIPYSEVNKYNNNRLYYR